MMQDGDLADGTRKAIKVGICLLLVGQILANAYRFYVHGKLAPIRTDPRIALLLMPGFIYLMATKVPEVLKKSAGIRRQAIHLADWWLALALWQFLAGMGNGPLIALFMIGAVIMALSVKDAIQVQA
jgi:hypothetical protein